MITLVTDSTAYLTKEEADRLKLRVVPMHYTIAGNSYTEGFADENKNFVDKIAANPDLCATAQASVADFVGMFQAIVHQGGEVLCVVISSRLSGAYSSACIAAKAVDAEKVRVVDSRTTAGGLALLLKKAAKLIRQGYPLEDIVAQVKKQREKTGIAFSVEDMESLRKSGRLSIGAPVRGGDFEHPADPLFGKRRRRIGLRRHGARTECADAGAGGSGAGECCGGHH